MTGGENGSVLTEKSLLLPSTKQFYFKMNIWGIYVTKPTDKSDVPR